MSGYWLGSVTGVLVAVAIAELIRPGVLIDFALGFCLAIAFGVVGHIVLDLPREES